MVLPRHWAVGPACLAAFLLAGCGSDGASPPMDRDPTSLVRFLDRTVPGLLREHDVPGAAVAVVHDGAVFWARGFGLADRERDRPVSVQTVFQAASISKPVTAWGVMRLVEQGKLGLDAPVGRYLARWQLPASEFDRDEVTVRRLLSHTAGLSLGGYPGLDPGRRLPTLEASLSGATGGAGDVRLVQEPGSAFSYSGGGYTLLQLLVEEVTGERFADYMQREVLQPLGMRRSAFVWTAELRADTARAYDGSGNPQPNYLFTEQAPAGLYTTVEDLARFVAAAMRGPRGEPVGRGLLAPATLKSMLSPAPATDGAYGLGYFLEQLPDGLAIAGHSGSNRGWRTQLAMLPATGAGIVVLTNSDNGGGITDDLASAWSEWAAASAR